MTLAVQSTEMVPLAKLRPYPRNARAGDTDAIRESLRKHGQYRALVVNKRTMEVLAGNHTLHALFELDATEALVHFVDVDDIQAAQINLIDNRTNDLAKYDDGLLVALLTDVKADAGTLEGTGFGQIDFDLLVRRVGTGGASNTDPEAVPEAPAIATTQPGDAWQLGEHRLVCGDSLRADDLRTLMRGERATLIYTDPPYGVAYDGGTVKRQVHKGDRAVGAELEALFAAPFQVANLVGTDDCGVMVWHAGALAKPLYDAVAAHGWKVRSQIIWNKNLAQFGALSAQYHQKHEPLLYCVRPDRPPKWRGPTNEVTIWDCNRSQVNEFHPTQKPVELAERAIANHSDGGDLVLDLFGGSGSTLMGAHRLGRRARVMEIDPIYCDVICRRFQEHTGVVPIRESTGKEHSFEG